MPSASTSKFMMFDNKIFRHFIDLLIVVNFMIIANVEDFESPWAVLLKVRLEVDNAM